MKNNEYSLSNNFLKMNQMLWKRSFLQGFRKVFYYVDAFLLAGTKKKNVSYPVKEKKTLFVVYNMALGDGIMFRGVDKYLRDIYPKEQWHITIACQSAFKSLYEQSGIYDCVMPIDFSGSVVDLKKRRAMFKKLREYKYHCLYDPVGAELCTTNVFVSRAVLADEKIGVLDMTLPHYESSPRMRKKIYSKLVETHTNNAHLIEFYAECLKKLGAKDCVAQPAKLDRIDLPIQVPEKFFIVFPNASMGVKRWPAECFARVAERIYQKMQMPLLVCGTKHDEPTIMEMLEHLSGVPVINAIGATNIMQFAELIGRAALIVTNDTSAYHIGVAQDVNTYMICGGYTFHRYANYQYEALGRKNPVLVHVDMPCFDCNNHCIYNNKGIFPCIDQITVDMVWDKIQETYDCEE